jgi:hypothetical protein
MFVMSNKAHIFVVQAAKKYKNKADADEERAAVQMQSLYRGFRDRRQVRQTLVQTQLYACTNM